MSSLLRRVLPLYFSFLCVGGLIVYSLILNDRRTLSHQFKMWHSAVEATAPRLLIDGNLVKLDALLKTEQDIATIICNSDEQLILQNRAIDGIRGCGEPGGSFERRPLVFDSRLVGWLLIRPIDPLVRYLGKYLLVIAMWLLSSLVFFSFLRRRADIRLVDGLIRFVSGIDKNTESLRRSATGKEMNALVDAVVGYQEAQDRFRVAEITNEKNQIISKISAQVAHDIRSPLAALDNVISNIHELPEDDRILVRMAVNRIKDIANNLIEKNRELNLATRDKSSVLTEMSATTENSSVQLLSSLVDPLVSEKRMQFRSKIGVEIDGRLDAVSYGLFAKVQPTEFKRVLSNLVNNAVEALGNTGNVAVFLARNNDWIEMRVVDNGKGISSDIISRLGQRGETHGKQGGSGLGLYHARTSVESWGGRLEITSQIGIGTSVIVTLPPASAPDWFVSELRLQAQSAVVVLDDDSSIHGIWQGRFDSLRVQEKGVEIFHFSTPDEFIRWVRESPSARTALYLADFELLGFGQTGLDLIETLNLGPQSILVTSRFEEEPLRRGCDRLKVRLIPKGLAGFVPISFEQPLDCPDYVLLDDDELVHMVWRHAAKTEGKKVLHFSHPDEFFSYSSKLHKGTAIFVDSQLGNGLKGEDIAKKMAAMGFTELWLCTGFSPANYRGLTYLRGCVGKDPPWGPRI